MQNFNVTTSDVAKTINKYDIFWCDLGPLEDAIPGVLSKKRPCVIVSSNNYNHPFGSTFIIAPIRTEHTYEVNDDNMESFLKIRRDTGRIYIPINLQDDGKSRFIQMDQIRMVSRSMINEYVGTIINEDVRKKINLEMRRLLFDDYEFSECVNKVNVSEKTESKNAPSQQQIPDKVNKILNQIKDGKVSITEASKTLSMEIDDLQNILFISSSTKFSVRTKVSDSELFPYYIQWIKGEMTQRQIAEKFGIHHSGVGHRFEKFKKIKL